MDRASIEKIRELIAQLTEQLPQLDASMSVTVLNKSVLKKEEICNLLIQIAEHKYLINWLETELGDTLGVDVKRLTDSLNANREGAS